LNEKFSAAGQIATIRLCRDSTTRRSLGYAYVNYLDPVSAQKAFDTLNFSEIKGKQCRVCWVNRDSSQRRSGLGNLHVSGLSDSVDNLTLYTAFSKFGTVLSSKICYNRDTHKPLGYAFVQFESDEIARDVVENKSPVTVGDSKAVVAMYKQRKDRQAQRFTNIYVKNLPGSWTKEKLDETFSQFGKITSSVLYNARPSPAAAAAATAEGAEAASPAPEALSYGFVSFETNEQAQHAIERANELDVEGRRVYAAAAISRAERERSKRDNRSLRAQQINSKSLHCNLYVKFLPETVTDDKVREVFARFGTITSLRVNRTADNGPCTGVAFVCYNAPEEANKAIAALNQSLEFGGAARLYVALHQPKTQRLAHGGAHGGVHGGHFRGGLPPHAAGGRFPGGGYGGYPQQGGYYGAPYGMYPAMGGARGGFRGGYAQGAAYGMHPGQMMMQQQGGYARGPRGVQGGVRGAGMGGMGPAGARVGAGPRGPRMGGAYGQQMGGQQGQMQRQRRPQQQQQQQQQGGVVAGGFDLAAFNSMPADQRRNYLGELVYPLVQALDEQHAPKITGMIIEMDHNEVIKLLHAPAELQDKVAEARQVLQEAGTTA